MSGPTGVGIVGEGPIAEAVCRELNATRFDRWPDRASIRELAIGVLSTWDPAALVVLNRAAVSQGVPLLLVHPEIGSVVVGPLVLPGESGCYRCANTRRRRALLSRPHELSVNEQVWGGRSRPNVPPVPGPVSHMVAALAALEADRMLAGCPSPTHCGYYRIGLETLKIEPHHFLADPSCPECGRLPLDTPEAACPRLGSRRKLGPTTYRVRSIGGERERLASIYSDPESGVVSGLSKDPSGIFATVGAALGLWSTVEMGVGRSTDYGSATGAALAEAMERYGGVRPVCRRTAVRDSYRNLGPDAALDPEQLGLPARQQIEYPGSPYQHYTPDLVMNWVWAYSFRRQRPLLVPERSAYYYLGDGDRPFLYEISNGCALGSCLEEAILHGLLEVAERDAFLLTWYAMLPVPRIDLTTAGDRTVGLMVERFETETGLRVQAYDITMPERIPCCWVMAVDEEDRPERPKLICAAGSSLDPEQAFKAGLHEVAALAPAALSGYPSLRARALEMLRDSDRVAQMEDHWVLYTLPEAWPRLGFLADSGRCETFREAFPEFYDAPGRNLDLECDLRDVLDRYLRTGLDVVVVDQTSNEHRAADLRCVKVLVPGTLSMTFGHRQRRTEGIARLRTVPVQLGYASAPLRDEELNPHPHPFP